VTAPLFAAAFATRASWAAAVGAGISMGFAEALSDDGSLTGRGSPLLRGLLCGVMTITGGLKHALPDPTPIFEPQHLLRLLSSFSLRSRIAAVRERQCCASNALILIGWPRQISAKQRVP
jgi:hypothetical protein